MMYFGGTREERQEEKGEESAAYVNERAERLRAQGSSSQEAAPDQGIVGVLGKTPRKPVTRGGIKGRCATGLYAVPDSAQTVIYSKRRQRDAERGQSGDTDNIYESLEDVRSSDVSRRPQEDRRDNTARRHTQRGTQRSRVVAVSLGVLSFLLLAGIIGLQVNYNRLTALHDSEMQRVRTQNRNLTEDIIQLQTSYANLTEQFNTMYKTLTADKDLLQKEVDYVKATGTVGWKSFNGNSYLITNITPLKTWSESRQHCQSNGADLVSINSREEHDFLVKSQKVRAWIGLSDQASEGTWQWVDGTVLQGEGFWMKGEPNDENGKEDCVELLRGTWNDAPCNWGLNWICEK